jgi:hypothetical protein
MFQARIINTPFPSVCVPQVWGEQIQQRRYGRKTKVYVYLMFISIVNFFNGKRKDKVSLTGSSLFE